MNWYNAVYVVKEAIAFGLLVTSFLVMLMLLVQCVVYYPEVSSWLVTNLGSDFKFAGIAGVMGSIMFIFMSWLE